MNYYYIISLLLLLLHSQYCAVAWTPIPLEKRGTFHLISQTKPLPLEEIPFRKQSSLLHAKDGDGSDDGWEDEKESLENKAAELRQLQAQRNQALTSTGSSPSSPSSKSSNAEPERDIFIPVFAIVSLLGLFGSYGYEMLRLYSRGELYLPWDNHL